MVRRLLVGLIIGLVVGGLLAAALVGGLKVTVFQSGGEVLLAYLASAAAGVLTGLVAGKPIWTSGAKVEAGLKAIFGALIAAGGMFALRQWAGGVHVDLSALGPLGNGAVGSLPAVSLPLLSAALGAFFELDNTEETGSRNEKSAPVRSSAAASSTKRVAAQSVNGRKGRSGDVDEAPEADVSSGRAKR
ncbi:MAG: hypothetical protein ABSC94_21610 [Polyangiaceae bacterium]|jgi:hypothetical protein